MKRKFTANLILLLLLNALVKPLWIFGIDRSVQNILGAADYGLYYALFNLSLILNIVLDLGLTNYNNREISRYPNMLAKYVPNILSIKLLLSIFYAMVTLAVAMFMGYRVEHMPILIMLIINQFLSSLILYLRSNLNALQFFTLDSILSVLDKLLMILLCGMVIWGRLGCIKLSIKTFVLAQTISYVLAVLVAGLLVVRRGGRLVPRFNRVSALVMLKQSYPYAILVLLMATYGRMDILVVERLLPNGGHQAGVYAQAFRLVDAYNMFPFLVASLLLPIFSRMIKEQQPVNQFVGYSFKVMLVPVLAVAVPTYFFRSQLMDLLYSAHALESAQIMGVLIGSFVFISINYVFGTLLTAQGAIRTLNLVSALAVGVGLILQVVLVQWFGLIGAAIGNLCVNALVATAQVLLSVRILHISLSVRQLVTYVIFLVLSVLIGGLALRFAPTMWMFGMSVAAIILLAFALGLVKVSDLLIFIHLKFHNFKHK